LLALANVMHYSVVLYCNPLVRVDYAITTTTDNLVTLIYILAQGTNTTSLWCHCWRL